LGGTTNNGTAFGDPQVSNGAFVFDGTGDYITNTRSGYSSSGTYTVSTWVNIGKEASGQTSPNIFQYGRGQTSTTDTGIGLITSSSDDRITAFVYGNNDFTVYGIKKYGTWIHLTSVYELSASGTILTLYVNGNNEGSQATSTGAGIGATPHLSIGVQANSSDLPINATYFTGSIANFRLFNRVLTSDEIYQLYAYQKEYFGHGDLGMTLKAGRLGIGTSEPRAALDVRGDARLYGINHCSAYKSSGGYVSKGNSYAWTALTFDTFLTEYGGFEIVNNGIRIPVSGVYHCYTHAVFTKSTTTTWDEWRMRIEFWVNDTNESNGIDYSNMGRVYSNMQLRSGMEGNRGFAQIVSTRMLVLNAGDILYSKVLGNTDNTTQIDERSNNLQVFMIQAI